MNRIKVMPLILVLILVCLALSNQSVTQAQDTGCGACIYMPMMASSADPASTLVPVPTSTPAPTATATATSTSTYTPTATATPTSTPTPTLKALILSSYLYALPTPNYGYWVYYEVQNVGTVDICGVEVSVRAYRTDGSDLFSTLGQVYLRRLTAGQKSPGKESLPVRDEVGRLDIEVLEAHPCAALDSFAPLTVVSTTISNVSGNAEIIGELRNDYGVTIDYLRAVVTFYFPDGTIQYGGFSELNISSVASGQTVPFYSIFYTEGVPDVANVPYSFQVDGIKRTYD